MGKIEAPLYGVTPDGEELRTHSDEIEYARNVFGVDDFVYNFERNKDGDAVLVKSGVLKEGDGFFRYLYEADSHFYFDELDSIYKSLSECNLKLAYVFKRFYDSLKDTYKIFNDLWSSSYTAICEYADKSQIAQTELANNINSLSSKLDKLGL